MNTIQHYYTPLNVVLGGYTGITLSVRLANCSLAKSCPQNICNYFSDFVQIWPRCFLLVVVMRPRLTSLGAHPQRDTGKKFKQVQVSRRITLKLLAEFYSICLS